MLAVYGNVPFYLELGFNFSNYSKAIFPYFLVLVCKSPSQMYKNLTTSGEKYGSLAICQPFSWQVWPQGSIILLGGRWAAWAVNSSDLWPTFVSQKLVILNLCRDNMLRKSTIKAPCRQKRAILQVCEHMLHPFDLYGHPRAFIWAKNWKPSFHCKQMVLLTRKVKFLQSFSHTRDLKKVLL